MAVWVIRGGKHGERESKALVDNVLTIGWNNLDDLTNVETKKQVREVIQSANPHFTQFQLGKYAGEVWAFIDTLKAGDLVVMPRKGQPTFAVGEISGDYKYCKSDLEMPHGRGVSWIKQEIPKNDLKEDLKGAFYTVSMLFCPHSTEAEKRFRAIATSGIDPLKPPEPSPDDDDPPEDLDPQLDLAEVGNSQVKDYVGQKFHGHEFTRLVAEVLKALGYGVEVAPPGPDGGVDIVAGGGPMAFDPPRICVQVKSGSGSTDVHVLRELAGAIKNFGADYGLLVSWGGFNSAAKREARESSYFNMRLWDAETFLELLFDNYDKLPSVLKAELPLKQIWVLDEPTM